MYLKQRLSKQIGKVRYINKVYPFERVGTIVANAENDHSAMHSAMVHAHTYLETVVVWLYSCQ